MSGPTPERPPQRSPCTRGTTPCRGGVASRSSAHASHSGTSHSMGGPSLGEYADGSQFHSVTRTQHSQDGEQIGRTCENLCVKRPPKPWLDGWLCRWLGRCLNRWLGPWLNHRPSEQTGLSRSPPASRTKAELRTLVVTLISEFCRGILRASSCV